MIISFEGIDGSGKSTQAKLLYEHYKSKGIKVSLSAEPTHSGIGSEIRQMLNDGSINKLSKERVIEMFYEDRIEHIARLKEQNNEIDIIDRYSGSTLAYQLGDKDADPEEWQRLKSIILSWNKKVPKAFITVYLHITPEKALKRLAKRSNNNSFDKHEVLLNAYNNYKFDYFDTYLHRLIVATSDNDDVEFSESQLLDYIILMINNYFLQQLVGRINA